MSERGPWSERLERWRLMPFTILAILVCVGNSFAIHANSVAADSQLSPFGALMPADIWAGHVYGLVTSAFVHVDPLHLFFNMYMLYLLGGLLERKRGSLFFVVFVVCTAAATSAAQLIASTTDGIGFSGVGYAMFGLLWAARRYDASLGQVVDNRMAGVLIGWAILCLVFTYTDIMSVANTAHFVGFALGWVLGRWVYAAPLPGQYALLGVFAAILVGVSLYQPWSHQWSANRAWRLHQADDLERAGPAYDHVLRLNPEDDWAWHNRGVVYQNIGDYERAAIHFMKARELRGELP